MYIEGCSLCASCDTFLCEGQLYCYNIACLGWKDRPARRGMRVDVMYSGRASVHHSMDTKPSKAAQFCS